jgi:hypothetical protein
MGSHDSKRECEQECLAPGLSVGEISRLCATSRWPSLMSATGLCRHNADRTRSVPVRAVPHGHHNPATCSPFNTSDCISSFVADISSPVPAEILQIGKSSLQPQTQSKCRQLTVETNDTYCHQLGSRNDVRGTRSATGDRAHSGKCSANCGSVCWLDV